MLDILSCFGPAQLYDHVLIAPGHLHGCRNFDDSFLDDIAYEYVYWNIKPCLRASELWTKLAMGYIAHKHHYLDFRLDRASLIGVDGAFILVNVNLPQ
jgi:hypothetical protein